MARPAANPIRLIDDHLVRVTRWEFEAGAETGWHTHELDYLVTTLTTCHFLLEEPDGKIRHEDMEPGTVYRRDKGVEHNVVNAGDEPMAFVEVELKD